MNRASLFAIISTVFLACLVTESYAAANPEVTAACKSDALKFCRPVIRDETKRLACMKDHASELSKGCRDAIKKNGMGDSGQ
jgi:hypothetical protein